jgi:heterodisulfide reductase subunit C
LVERVEASAEIAKPIRLDPRFRREIMAIPGGETLKVCFQCGTCTSSCPIARFSRSYRPRQIIQMTQLGMKSKVLSSDTLWLCAACFTCTDRCPQGVEVASVLRVLRNLAVKEGFMPAVHRELASNILATGYAYRITVLQNKKREEFGLPPLPKANIKDLAKLSQSTDLLKLIETRRASSVQP